MHEYAHWQTATLLRRLGKEAARAARASDPETVHDLRVAIRRLNGCLRLFTGFYASGSRKDLKKGLKKLMKLCAAVRDRDIAMELLAEAGVPPSSAVVRRLEAERKDAAHDLRAALKGWKGARCARDWRTRLEL